MQYAQSLKSIYRQWLYTNTYFLSINSMQEEMNRLTAMNPVLKSS
ncbi:MAG: hypothetical protein ABIQ31_10875 [Ferruginibacter sp.]